MATTTMRQSVWISVLTTVVALAIYLVVAFFIPLPEQGLPLITLGVLLALIPAIIWLGFFYQRDHVEPEPKRLVARVFLFGALAATLAVPVTELFMQNSVVVLDSLVARFVVTTLSVSLIQEVLKVAMVRYVVLGTDEFDEQPDGIVYGLAAGLGFATVINIGFVLQSGGVLPLQAAIQATNNALVQGALGAFTGYFVGRVKLDGERLEWLVTGLVIATLVNGLYHTVSDEVTSLGLSFQPGYALVVAVVLALGLGAVLFALFRRAHHLAAGDFVTITQQAQARSLDMPWDIAPRYDSVLVAALVVALVVGFGVGLLLNEQTVDYRDPALPVSLSYPASWGVESSASGLFLIDLEAGAAFAPTFQMSANKVAGDAALQSLEQERILRQEQQLDFYRAETRGEGPSVGGQPTRQVVYSYVTLTNAGPVVVRGMDTLLLFEDRLYIFRYVAEADDFSESLERYQQILGTVRLG